MKRSEVIELKERYTELLKWRRQAAFYEARYGNKGSLETRQKHAVRLVEADREIPLIEAKLKAAWVS